MNQGVADYTLALAVASGFVGLLATLLPIRPSDGVFRVLLFLANLGAVVYLSWSTGTLDVQHSGLVYVGVALGIPAVHVAIKYKSNGSDTPSNQNAPVAPQDGQQTASAVDVASVVASAQNAATATLDTLKASA